MIIDYKDSPTGKVIVTDKAVMPLMPLKTGFGFEGVLLESSDMKFVQCAICGGWYKKLSAHLSRKHKTTREVYIEQHGLKNSESLASSDFREKCATEAEKRGFTWLSPVAGKIGELNSKYKRVRTGKRAYYKNIRGTCKAQIKSRIIDYLKTHKKLPARTDYVGKGILRLLKDRFGSINQGFKHYGLPERFIGKGGGLVHKFPDGEEILINQQLKSDIVYELIKTKCPKFLTDEL